MAIDVIVLSKNVVFWNYSEREHYFRHFGRISDLNLKKIKDFAEELNLKLFRFIDPYDHTVFNSKQMGVLLEEINALKPRFDDENAAFSIISNAVDVAQKISGCYLKFKGE